MTHWRLPTVGERYGRLTVIGDLGTSGGYHSFLCRCDCGAEVTVRGGSSLRHGHQKSCGCLSSELPSRRFWERVLIQPDGCWLWMGTTNQYGYGSFVAEGFALAHRWSYHHFRAPIPDSLQVHHECGNRTCVNPAHLECVTLRENLIRGKKTNQYANRTHCSRGHEYTPENTAFQTHPNGKRTRCCRECRRGHNQRAAVNISEKRKEGEPCAACSKLVLPSEAAISRRTYGWAVCSECREGGKISPPTEATEP